MSLQILSAEEVYAALHKKRVFVANDTFEDYTVTTAIELDEQSCRFHTWVSLKGKEIRENKDVSPVQGEPWETTTKEAIVRYIDGAKRQHADRCYKVRHLVQAKGKSKKKRAILVFLILIVLVGFLVEREISRLIEPLPPLPRVTTPVSQQPAPEQLTSEDITIEYSAIRSHIEDDPLSGKKILLEKDDVLTVKMVNRKTGETLTQGILNVEIKEK